MEIPRTPELRELRDALRRSPVVSILGPRQCGKTTLARQFAHSQKNDSVLFLDLENPLHAAELNNPMMRLSEAEGYVILDEVQRQPELFPILRVLADRKPQKAHFILLGSASPDLLKRSSESLAGRVSFIEMSGFSQDHIPAARLSDLWIRGGFPESFLSATDSDSVKWRNDFVRTFLERDLPALGLRIPAASMRQFWMMLAHYHGQIFNASELARSLAVNESTARRYLDILGGTFMVRPLQPWYYNTKKRLVKRPKIYFRDSGILHALLSVNNRSELLAHPKLGASWEGFALEAAIRRLELAREEVFFWQTHAGAELDAVFQRSGRLWGLEVKYSETPRLTPSMKSAHEELKLAHLWVIHPGPANFPLDARTTAVSIQKLSVLKPSLP